MAEGTSDIMVEVPSEHYSGSDSDDNMYLYFNYSTVCKKGIFGRESKMGEWEKPNR